jgi:hypothetical protein
MLQSYHALTRRFGLAAVVLFFVCSVLNPNASPVPEPSSILLIGSGLLLLVTQTRHRLVAVNPFMAARREECMRRSIHPLAMLVVLALPVSSFAVDFGDLNPTDPAKGTIDHAEQAVQRLLAQAQQVGNGLESNAASQLDAIAQGTLLILGNDVTKQVKTLNTMELAALLGLEKATKSLNVDIQKAYDLRDTTIVDITQWKSGIPFTETPDFFIQTIHNTAFLPQPGDYHITLVGYGFGEVADLRTTITAQLEGHPVALSEVDQTTNYGTAIIAIPNASLQPLFRPTGLNIVTLSLSVTVSRKHFLTGSTTHQYTFPVHLTLYPPQLATATLHVTRPVNAWVDTGTDTLSAGYTTPEKGGCDGNPGCRANNGPIDIRVPGPLSGPTILGQQRIIEARLQCNSGSICNFSDCQQISIVDNATHASATWCTWSHPTQWQLRGHVQEFRTTGSQTSDQQIPIIVDHPVTVQFPSDYSLATLDVKTYTGFVYTMVLPANDSHNIVNAALNVGNTYVFSGITPIP